MMKEELEPQYAPLLDTDVVCTLLDVYELEGDEWRPAYDHEDTLIQLLVTEGVRELSERVIRPGRYRVVARNQRTKRMITRKDWNIRPSRRSSTSATPAFQIMGVYQQQARAAMHAHARVEKSMMEERKRFDEQLEAERKAHTGQLEAERKHHEAMLTAIRERADSEVKSMRDQLDTARTQGHKAEVTMASLGSRLEARDERVIQLEDQLEELRAEVMRAQGLAADLKQKADDSEFSPLDAILQMDQALEVLGKTAERFGKK